VGYRLLDKVRILALRRDYAKADIEFNQLLTAGHQKQDVVDELGLFCVDCQKIGLDDAMFWAAKWLIELDKTAAMAYVRILSYYERRGMWAELNAAMERADAEVPEDHVQRPFLNRNMSRIRRSGRFIKPTADREEG